MRSPVWRDSFDPFGLFENGDPAGSNELQTDLPTRGFSGSYQLLLPAGSRFFCGYIIWIPAKKTRAGLGSIWSITRCRARIVQRKKTRWVRRNEHLLHATRRCSQRTTHHVFPLFVSTTVTMFLSASAHFFDETCWHPLTLFRPFHSVLHHRHHQQCLFIRYIYRLED